MRESDTKKRSELWKNGWILQYDNDLALSDT